jgi:hypothetical protein
VIRAVLIALLCAAACAHPVLAASDPIGGQETRAQAYAAALRASIGAPARVELADQATVRLEGPLVMIPRDPAARYLAAVGRAVPEGLLGLLLGTDGIDTTTIVRFVPAGFVDTDEATRWTEADMLDSLNDAVQRTAPLKEARSWARPPKYDAEERQLSWTALILPKDAPKESDGEVTTHAIGFGREGYIELTAASSLQQSAAVGRLADAFLRGLHFLPGKRYADAQPTDKKAPEGLAGAMGIGQFHRRNSGQPFWASSSFVPTVGGVVAGIGALALLIYIQRTRRQEARRI